MGLVVCSYWALTVCGPATADESIPLDEVRAQAQEMDAGGLRDMAMAYKKAIEAKLGDLDKVKDQMKEIPLTEMVGDEAKKLQQEVEALTQSINALKKRFSVYHARLEELDGDLSGLAL